VKSRIACERRRGWGGLRRLRTIGEGAILTESVCNLHGVGQYAAQSIGQKGAQRNAPEDLVVLLVTLHPKDRPLAAAGKDAGRVQ